MTPELIVPCSYASGINLVKTRGIYFVRAFNSLPVSRVQYHPANDGFRGPAPAALGPPQRKRYMCNSVRVFHPITRPHTGVGVNHLAPLLRGQCVMAAPPVLADPPVPADPPDPVASPVLAITPEDFTLAIRACLDADSVDGDPVGR